MSIPQGEVDAVTMFAVEILWHSPFRFHDRPSVNQAPSEREAPPKSRMPATDASILSAPHR